MKDGELRDLCNRFFDAVESHDLDALRVIYAPDLRFWANVADGEATREQNLQVLIDGKPRHRRRTYDDRVINTFPTGFVARYSCNIMQHNGVPRSLSSCLIAQCSDGQITRIDAYLDSSKFTDASRRPAAK